MPYRALVVPCILAGMVQPKIQHLDALVLSELLESQIFVKPNNEVQLPEIWVSNGESFGMPLDMQASFVDLFRNHMAHGFDFDVLIFLSGNLL